MATTKKKTGTKSASTKPAAKPASKPAASAAPSAKAAPSATRDQAHRAARGGPRKAPAVRAAKDSASLAYKPGQTLSITLTKAPRSDSVEKTLLRLMRMDAGIKKALKAGHDVRMGRLHIRSRGGRPWEVREKSARIARVEKGRSFTLKFYPAIGPDLAVAAPYIAVKAG